MLLSRKILFVASLGVAAAFVPNSVRPSLGNGRMSPVLSSSVAEEVKTEDGDVEIEIDDRTGKPIGSTFLPEETLARAAKGSPVEKAKLKKDGTYAFVDVYEYARKIRQGEMTWEEIEKSDLETRLKWVGMVHRGKRTPGQFMMRLRVPNGIVNSDQMRFYADTCEPYGDEKGVIDITTRANIQLRGIKLDHAEEIIEGLHARNQTSFHSALDNVRNMVGSPLAGIDDKEMVDTRDLCNDLNDLISLDRVTGTRGNPTWGNMPRKFNIAVSGSRDDYAHTHINDIGLQPVAHAETGEMGFNVVLGGYMSIKRVATAVEGNMWIASDRNSVYTLSEAILRIFRDEGNRKDRQKARLMWLVEDYGIEEFKAAVTKEIESYDRGVTVHDAQPLPTDHFDRRELLGIHKQPQEGKFRVGIAIPSGRLSQAECRDLADLADKYSDGEIRLTVEQNCILPNVDESELENLLAEPKLDKPGSRLKVNPGFIAGNVVSCTGAQFCGLALIETKMNAEEMGHKLEELVTVEKPIRIHWTGCPNSCGQVQAADIGIMGGPARKEVNGKKMAVPGCKIFVGGTIGENGHLSLDPYKKGIALEDLIPELVEILVDKFGAVVKEGKEGEATGNILVTEEKEEAKTSEVKAEKKTEVKTEKKTEVKAEKKIEVKAEKKIGVKADKKAEVTTEKKAETKAEKEIEEMTKDILENFKEVKPISSKKTEDKEEKAEKKLKIKAEKESEVKAEKKPEIKTEKQIEESNLLTKETKKTRKWWYKKTIVSLFSL